MTRDDLVKRLEKAAQRQAATRDHHISISLSAAEAVFRAGDALHIWDIAYAAGVAAGVSDEKARCAAICRKEAAETDKHLSIVIEALEDCAYLIENRGERNG